MNRLAWRTARGACLPVSIRRATTRWGRCGDGAHVPGQQPKAPRAPTGGQSIGPSTGQAIEQAIGAG